MQGRFQFSEEIKDSSLKSLVVFIIAKRRVKKRRWRGEFGFARTFAAVTAVQTMLSGCCSLAETAKMQWQRMLASCGGVVQEESDRLCCASKIASLAGDVLAG